MTDDSARGQTPSMADDIELASSDEPKNPAASDAPAYAGDKGTWLSPEDDDPERDEAAERARQAVRPDKPRE